FTIQAGDPSFPEAPNGGTVVFTDGTLNLQSNGTFVETDNYTVTPSGQAGQFNQFQASGTWSLNGSTFTLNDQANQRFDSGTLETDANGRLTVNFTESVGNGQFASFEYKK
ncbi:MAG: hypothetical protein QOI93_5152, partial [Rhodospirillaceae bacterium]|nr:hypothetical protein [Rhodospirillaceae bacterium]